MWFIFFTLKSDIELGILALIINTKLIYCAHIWDSSPKSQINLVPVLFQLKVTLDISLCSDNWFASRRYLTLTQLKFFLHFTLIELSGRSTLDMTEIISFQLELSERGSFVKEWKFWNEIPLKNSFEVKLPILYFTKISSASSSV